MTDHPINEDALRGESDRAFSDSIWRCGPRPYSLMASDGVTLEHGPFGYAIHDEERGKTVTVSWNERLGRRNVTDSSLVDGSWAATVERSGDAGAWKLFWLYPYSLHVHFWILDEEGRRIGSGDLDHAQCASFFARWAPRCMLLAVKHAMRCAVERDFSVARELLARETNGEDAGRNPELLWLVLNEPDAFDPDLPRKAYRLACDLVLAGVASNPGFAGSDIGRARFGRLITAIAQHMDRGAALDGAGIPHEDERRQASPQGHISPPRASSLMRLVDFNAFPNFPQKALLGQEVRESLLFNKLSSPASEEDGVRIRIDFDLMPTLRRPRIGLRDERSPLLQRVVFGASAALFAIERYICHPAMAWDIADRMGIRPGSSCSVYLQLEDNEHDTPHSLAWNAHSSHPKPRLVPDIYFTNDLGYAAFRREIRQRWIPWTERQPKAFWRGSTTGVQFVDGEGAPPSRLPPGLSIVDDPEALYPRLRLCLLSTAHPSLIDAGFTQIVQYPSPNMRDALHRHYAAIGVLRNPVPQIDFIQYRYGIDIDGNTCAWGLIQKLLLGSCLLKVASENRQWFYDRLRPWEHYVPVHSDMSDLVDKLEWCERNPAIAAGIAEEGRRFALSLGYEDQMKAYADTILETMFVA